MLAALTNALRVVGKTLAGRADRRLRRRRRRHAIIQLLLTPGRARHHRLRPRRRRAQRARQGLDPFRQWIADTHQPATRHRLAQGGRSPAPTSSSASPRRTCSPATTSPRWPTDAIVFALANPDPEVDPARRSKHAAVVATGRSDYPNQINNVLAFPGFFRGLLDAGAHEFTDEMLLAAATAIADCVGRRAQPELHRAQRLRPTRRAGGRRRRPRAATSA